MGMRCYKSSTEADLTSCLCPCVTPGEDHIAVSHVQLTKCLLHGIQGQCAGLRPVTEVKTTGTSCEGPQKCINPFHRDPHEDHLVIVYMLL